MSECHSLHALSGGATPGGGVTPECSACVAFREYVAEHSDGSPRLPNDGHETTPQFGANARRLIEKTGTPQFGESSASISDGNTTAENDSSPGTNFLL
jgi:hypothetical protein